MGLNLSRPQYGYSSEYHRVSPSEYFRRCDPDNCYCGGSHTRRRHVAVHQSPGGQVTYQDPMHMMDALLMSRGYPGYTGGMGGYSIPNTLPYTSGPAPTTILLPGAGNSAGGTSWYPGWPAEWKDATDWTTRDYNRLGEIMEEYLIRQRGRGSSNFGMPGNGMFGAGMPMFNPMLSGNAMLPDNPMMNGMMLPNRPMLMESDIYTSNSFGRKGSGEGPTYLDFERLKEQMSKYAQDARDHVQSINDFLYGSERELREERYKDRQKKMVEDILKTLNIGGNNPPSMPAQPQPAIPMTQPPFNPIMGMGAPPGMNPYAAMNGMGNPSFMPGMSNMDPMAAFGDMRGGIPPRLPRPRRQPRGPGFGDEDEFGGGGGFGRRGRRDRGFDDEDDDFFNQDGDGRRGPRGPNNPRKPRPNNGGGNGGSSFGGRDDNDGFGAFFDDAPRPPPPERPSQPYEPPQEHWSQPYRNSSPPPIPPRPRPVSQPAPWPVESGKDPDNRWSNMRPPAYNHSAPEGRDRTEDPRHRVSFQEPPTDPNPPAGPSRYRIVNED